MDVCTKILASEFSTKKILVSRQAGSDLIKKLFNQLKRRFNLVASQITVNKYLNRTGSNRKRT